MDIINQTTVDNVSETTLTADLFDSICRICLSKRKDLLPINDVNIVSEPSLSAPSVTLQLTEIFEKYGITIYEGDQKPQQICLPCVNEFYKIYEICEKAETSNMILDRILEKKGLSLVSDNTTNENQSIGDERMENLIADTKSYSETEDDLENIKIMIEPSAQNVGITQTQLDAAQNLDDRSLFLEKDLKVQKQPISNNNLNFKVVEKISVENSKYPTTESSESETKDLPEVFECLHCEDKKPILGINSLFDHLENVHEIINRCLVCPLKFRSLNNLKYHMAMHSQNSIVCKMCKVVFRNKNELEEHHNAFHLEGDQTCSFCKKKFSNSNRKNHHVRTVHLLASKYICTYCGKNFANSSSLGKHERLHVTEKPFVCEKCGKGYTTKMCLKQHIQAVHVDPSTTLGNGNKIRKKWKRNEDLSAKVCPICGKSINQHWFYRHMQQHAEFKDFQCAACTNTFDTYAEYIAHQKTAHYHYVCSVCSKRFKSEKVLKDHYDFSHEGRSEYRCETCYKIFGHPTSLKSHTAIHLDSRPHSCKFCDKKFRQAAHLRIHMHQHDVDQKPHVCEICKKAFAFRFLLTNHTRIHTGQKPFKCIYCEKTFRDTICRLRHVKKIHPTELDDFLEYRRTEGKYETNDNELEFDKLSK